MKTPEKNEMDLLLRALGRDGLPRAQNGSASTGLPEAGSHLDADELNCYAEGVVSAAERARYVRHIADCDRCRHIVAELVPSAAFANRQDVTEKRTGWNWRESFSALFAPAVLRYAMPALALATIMAVAIVVLRRPSRPEFVAQNEPQTAPAFSGGSEDQKSVATSVPQLSGSPQNPPPSAAEKTEKNVSHDQDANVIQPARRAGTTANTDRPATGLVQPEESAGIAQSQPPSVVPGDAAAPPPPPRPTLDNAMKTAEARQEEADTELQKRRREDSYSVARDENEVARSGPAKGGPSRNNSPNMAGVSSVMSRAAKKTANKDDKAAGGAAETRRVYGRLFRRAGDAWVDSDYVPGRATVNVRRGSEQFRALIADEPALGSIAEQLGGEVIVVWKGAAYRIR